MQLRNSIELILYKTYADIKAEMARSYLGLIWWLIEPVLYLGAFYILFVLVLHRGGPDFVPTFLCGAVVWKWFDSGLKGGSHAISANRGLLQQVYVPKFIFPVIAVLGSTARFVPVFVVFTLFLLVYGIPIQLTWLAAPIVMLTQLFLIMALAMLVGAITPFLPDLKAAIDNGMMFLFFISGVFFNINDVHEPLRSYLLLNPMAGLIDEYRNAMLRGVWPDTAHLTIILLISFVLGALALALLKEMDHKYGKVRF
ncbi:MAG: ABC transporter permease [Gammaproteobacteria bacterium]|nr:ABC transporter permease [Gammaproteobacteria bacterium]